MQFCNGTDSHSVPVLLVLLDSKVTLKKSLSFEVVSLLTLDTIFELIICNKD